MEIVRSPKRRFKLVLHRIKSKEKSLRAASLWRTSKLALLPSFYIPLSFCYPLPATLLIIYLSPFLPSRYLLISFSVSNIHVALLIPSLFY
jgi:hypothetical protein